MSIVFKKLNLKEFKEIWVLNAPLSFEPELDQLHDVTLMRDLELDGKVLFALVFATSKTELDLLSRSVANKAHGDAILWFAYPKGTSQKYKCDFNRDTGWDVIRSLGFDSVRAVSIDQDWTALRFRRVEYIKSR